MYVDYMQILLNFIQEAWVFLDFGIQGGGPETNSLWI